MSDLIRIIGIGFIGGFLSLMIRRERPEFAVMTALITSAVILMSVAEDIGAIITNIERLIEGCGIDMKYFIISIKAVGVAYIAQFAAEILRDCGEGAIAAKIEAAGKISILALTLPVMQSLIELCERAVNSI